MEDCRRAGACVFQMLQSGLRPSDILTKKAFENAITVAISLGGSTNAVLHLLAIAHAAKVKLSLDDFTRVGRRVPVLADLKPSGRYLMSELVAIGGIRPLMKTLLEAGLLHGDPLTVTGQTMAETLKDVKPYPDGQEIIHSLDNPIKASSHIVILRGNLAEEGAVAKITGKEGTHFSGRAIVFNSEESALQAILDGKVKKGHVIVIRYEGPKGGPGMRENAFAHFRDYRQRPGQRRGAHYGRTIFRRQPRLRRGPHHAGSVSGRSHRFGEKRRPDHD